MVKKALAFVIIPALLCSTASQASDWRHWRGPFFNGSTDETNLPSRFSQTENVAWVSPLPGHSSATPIICKQRVFVSSTDRDSADLFALKSGGNWELSEDYVAWKFDGPTPDVCTPLYYKGNLYVLDGMKYGKVVTCLDAKTGRQKWQGRLGGPGPWRASLTAGDDKLYCINESGEVVVLAADNEQFKVLWRTDLGDRPVQASIAIAERHLFIRTANKLFCVGD